MQLTHIDDTINNLQWADYDINVWSEDGNVFLTFYPLRYPGDKRYPDADLEHGLPVVDTSTYYSLRINSKSHTALNRDALDYLRNMVNADHYDEPERYGLLWGADELPVEDDLDWWTCETALVDPPELIADFIATIPRRLRRAN